MIWYWIGLLLVLHVYLWGLGLTWLILPRRWRRFWPAFCAPVGLALQSAVVWAGTHTPLPGTDHYARAALILPVGLFLAAMIVHRPAGTWRLLTILRRWWGRGCDHGLLAGVADVSVYPAAPCIDRHRPDQLRRGRITRRARVCSRSFPTPIIPDIWV